jgi:hypothetical protein
MSEAPRATHTVRAVHAKPEFPPIVEVCPTPLAASIRAGQLYLFGYYVEVQPPLPGDRSYSSPPSGGEAK